MAAGIQFLIGFCVRKAPEAADDVNSNDQEQHGSAGSQQDVRFLFFQTGDFGNIKGIEEKHREQCRVEQAAQDIDDRNRAKPVSQVIVCDVQQGGEYQTGDDDQENPESGRFANIGKTDQRKHDETDRYRGQVADRCVIIRDEMRIRQGHRHHLG